MHRRLILGAVLIAVGLASSPGLAVAAPPSQADELASAPRISQAEFRKALAAGEILVLDVRDAQAYANGHIPGAISIPLTDLSSHAQELKAEKRPIVTYCS